MQNLHVLKALENAAETGTAETRLEQHGERNY